MLTGRTQRTFRIAIVVINILVAVASFRRGDTSAMVVAIAVAALFLIQLARSSSDGRGRGRDDRTPPSS